MFIDACLDGKNIWVSEKIGDVRNIKKVRAKYSLYYESSSGLYRSIYDDKLEHFTTFNKNEFKKKKELLQSKGIKLFESNTDPVLLYLEENYPDNDKLPSLNVSMIDIETDKDSKRGYARTNSPYAAITAITIHNQWNNDTYTLAIPPENLTHSQCGELLMGNYSQDLKGKVVDFKQDGFGIMSREQGYYICQDEAELLELFIEIIQDTDVISHWNGEWFDMPYIVARIRIVLGGEKLEDIVREDGTHDNPFNPCEKSAMHLRRMSKFGLLPKLKMSKKFEFSVPEPTYQFYGTVSLDYMDLYKKFQLEPRHSYALNFILKTEIKQTKIEYVGSLDQLYRMDFRRFIAYNRQDTMGLNDLDKKMKFISLANYMAHLSCCPLTKMTGTVQKVDRALIKQLHKNKKIFIDRPKTQPSDKKAPGAVVFEGIKGMFRHVASFDATSLYPSLIMALNISIDRKVGQFKLSKTEKYYDMIVRDLLGGIEPEMVSVNARDSAMVEAWRYFITTLEHEAILEKTDELFTLVFLNGEEVTASAKEWNQIIKENNWTLSGNATVFDNNSQGIVAECLSEWFKLRKKTKDQAGEYYKKSEKEEDEVKKKEYKNLGDYYNLTQQCYKVLLNSTYGALLNRFSQFYDEDLGRSVTMSGRPITHELAKQGNLSISRRINNG